MSTCPRRQLSCLADGALQAGLGQTTAVGIGALAIGDVKYHTQHRLLVEMRDKPKSVLGFAEAFATARAFLAESAAGKGG